MSRTFIFAAASVAVLTSDRQTILQAVAVRTSQ